MDFFAYLMGLRKGQAEGGGGGNDFKYFVMSNTDKYDASFELPTEDGTTQTFKKVWDYVAPDVSDTNNIGLVIVSGKGSNGELRSSGNAITKGTGGFGGFSGEDGFWSMSGIGTIETLFVAVNQDYVDMFAEQGLIIPEPGVYILSQAYDTPWAIIFTRTA